jgi:16S rRNA (cytidine1402-2'-O)-methyltransferase
MTLHLLPNLLFTEMADTDLLPQSVGQTVAQLQGLIGESPKEARLYLKRFGKKDIPIAELNEHTSSQELNALLEPLKRGEVWGLMSDAGMPCLADPGALLVRRVREEGLKIRAICGPSSLLLALILSGMPGQRFSFHGYLPREEEKRRHMLKELERRARQEEATQLFIETPYRNEAVVASALAVLSPKTYLTIALDLTGETEEVVGRRVEQWKKEPLPSLSKRPAVFILATVQ